MLRKFTKIGIDFSGKQLEYLRMIFESRISKQTDRQKRLLIKISKKAGETEWIVVILMGNTSIGRTGKYMQDDGHPSVLL